VSTDQRAAEAVAMCRWERPSEDDDKHSTGVVGGFACFRSKVTRMSYAAHAETGRFYRTVGEGSARMRGWTLRETIEEDRGWLRGALARLGWTIGAASELSPPARPAPVSGGGGATRPTIPAPVPKISRATKRLTIEEHTVAAELSAWDVRRALTGIGVAVPDTVAEVQLAPTKEGGLGVSWVETNEKSEDIT
jgi:hypothetical protein